MLLLLLLLEQPQGISLRRLLLRSCQLLPCPCLHAVPLPQEPRSHRRGRPRHPHPSQLARGATSPHHPPLPHSPVLLLVSPLQELFRCIGYHVP